MAQVLFEPKQNTSPWRTVFNRLAILLALYLLVLAFFLWDKEGLRDSTKAPGQHITTLDLVYFTAITMSTVGYGDIVPVTPLARTIDILLVTPIRVIVWLLFVGTTVQFTYSRFREDYALQKLKETLRNHTIVCGYGMTGRAAAEELVQMGGSRDNIIVVDDDADVCQQASDDGFNAIKGDGTREAILEIADIKDASNILVSTNRDDTNILICLTAKNLNQKITIAAAVNQTENLKLMKSSGASTTVVPSMAGGHILAASTRFDDQVSLLEDLLTTGGKIKLMQETVGEKLKGKLVADVEDCIVIGLDRSGKRISINEMKKTILEPGDVLISIKET